jgi:hypothetical protein
MIRPDLMFFEDLKIEIYQYEFDFCEKASIQFLFQPPIIVTQNNKILHIPLAFDLFWFSKPSTMNMFINECYEKFEYYYVDFPQKALPPGVHAPEMSCEEIASQLGILPKFYLFPYKIKRKEDMYDCKSILL